MAEIGIQVMDPAEITLPVNVHQMAFMNRSVYPQLVHSDSTSWTSEEFFILDTIMNIRIFMGVRTAMNESPLFELDSIEVIQARRTDTDNILESLGKVDLKKIKMNHPSDALVSLEYYNIDDSLDVDVFFDEGIYYQAYLGFYTTSVWRIYDFTSDTAFDEYVLQDTSVWYGYADTHDEAVLDLPLAINAIRTAAYEIGKRYGYRISPGWMEVPRFFYRGGNKEMRMASKKVVAGDWPEAADAWRNIAAVEEDNKMAAKACFNLALIYEMEDLLIPALDWAVKSYTLRQAPLTREYIEILQQRYEDRKKLKSQLPQLDQ